MNSRFLFKVVVVVGVLTATSITLTTAADVRRRIKVVGPDAKTTLQIFDTSNVSYIEVTEDAGDAEDAAEDVYPNATIAKNGDLLIELAPELIFRMVRVEGGVDYALQDEKITWSVAQKTKSIETFYLGQFEVTQGLWKYIKGSVPSNQTVTGDRYPVAQVSWDMIAGSESNTFLNLINAMLAEIKQNNPTVGAVLGSREFRLPSEWEWEYAAAGGKNWETLNYYYSGTSESTAEALESVAVNNVSPYSSPSVAEVGSKLPNILGLYDMSGNVWEWCSGLGYPTNPTTAGYQETSNSSFSSAKRPNRGGSQYFNDSKYFRVSYRSNNSSSALSGGDGFRLAL